MDVQEIHHNIVATRKYYYTNTKLKHANKIPWFKRRLHQIPHYAFGNPYQPMLYICM